MVSLTGWFGFFRARRVLPDLAVGPKGGVFERQPGALPVHHRGLHASIATAPREDGFEHRISFDNCPGLELVVTETASEGRVAQGFVQEGDRYLSLEGNPAAARTLNGASQQLRNGNAWTRDPVRLYDTQTHEVVEFSGAVPVRRGRDAAKSQTAEDTKGRGWVRFTAMVPEREMVEASRRVTREGLNAHLAQVVNVPDLMSGLGSWLAHYYGPTSKQPFALMTPTQQLQTVLGGYLLGLDGMLSVSFTSAIGASELGQALSAHGVGFEFASVVSRDFLNLARYAVALLGRADDAELFSSDTWRLAAPFRESERRQQAARIHLERFGRVENPTLETLYDALVVGLVTSDPRAGAKKDSGHRPLTDTERAEVERNVEAHRQSIWALYTGRSNPDDAVNPFRDARFEILGSAAFLTERHGCPVESAGPPVLAALGDFLRANRELFLETLGAAASW